MKFGHIALRIKNLDSMLEFYCQCLGLKEAFRIFNDDGSLRIVYIHISQGQYLELCLGGEEVRVFDDKTTIGYRHLCLLVDDLEQVKREMETKGIIFDTEILILLDRNKTCYLKDPEGNKIELMQTMPDSPQMKFF